jgi:hypothetical protein
MEWVLKLEARGCWGEVETIEVGRVERGVSGLTAEELGLTLAESKTLLAWSSKPKSRNLSPVLVFAGVAWGSDVSATDGPGKSRRFSGPSRSTRLASALARAGVGALSMSRGLP